MIRLDLADIQGNIHRPYGRFGFPHTRHFFLHISDASAGRRFVQGVRPRITTAEPWEKAQSRDGTSIVVKPLITLNIGFTFYGLRALDVPTRTLRLLPDEFIDGMGTRSEILGDVGGSSLDDTAGLRDQAQFARSLGSHLGLPPGRQGTTGTHVGLVQRWCQS